MRAFRLASTFFVLFVFGCETSPQVSPSDQGGLQSAIDETMSVARRAIDDHGATKKGLSEIAKAMARLGQSAALIDDNGMRPIHGSSLISQRALASEGPEGINLYLTRLLPGAKTPVHDHATWGVVHVLNGRDRHVRWQRTDDGANPDKASLRQVEEQLVGPGQSVIWLPPPADIHTQEAADGTVWELVMTGQDLSHATASGHRHWFDLQTGQVSHQPPK